MENGFGSPYVKVYSSAGEITSRITDFSYKYSQEEDDVCQLRVEEKDTNLPDRAEFQEGAILTVVWGYIAKEYKKTRRVKISNIKASYTETTVCLDLLCTDLVSDLKKTSSKKVHKGTLNDIAKEVADKNGLKFNGIVDTDQGLAIDGTAFHGYARPGFYDQNGNYTIAVDNTAVPRQVHLRIYDQLPQANKSDFRLLKEAAAGDPNGPFEVVGRDGTLSIQKKNLNQKPIAVYTYASGDGLLLSFHPETKNLTRQQSSSNISTDLFNPENKTAYNLNSNSFTNKDPKLGDVTEVPARFSSSGISGSTTGSVSSKQVITGPNKKNQVASYPDKPLKNNKVVNSDKPQSKVNVDTNSLKYQLEQLDNANIKADANYQLDGADKFNGNYGLDTAYGIIHFTDYNTAAPGFYDDHGNYTVAIDKTAVIVPHGEVVVKKKQPTDNTKSLPSSEHDIEEAFAKGSNLQAEAALQKNPAELIVVGNPLLESGKIVTILNVSKKYSGNYYIEECVHSMNFGQAYKTTMKLTKNALGKTGVDAPDKVKVDSFDNIPKAKKTTIINKEIKEQDLKGKSLTDQLKILGPETPMVKLNFDPKR